MPGLGCLFGDISGEELVLEIVALEACVEDSNSVVRVALGKLDIADVAAGVLENLPQILQVLSQEQRDKYIELFIQAQNKAEQANKTRWR